jgi:CubicO group peptidase (beta-lactamase class C family)
MNRSLLISIFAAVLLLPIIESQSQPLYFPPLELTDTTWETVSPALLGWHTDRIDTLMNFLEANRTKAFLVLKDGHIVLERYFGTFTRDSNWYWASAGKTLTAFLIGIAQQDRLLSINDSTSHYLGAGWTSCPAEKEGLITILNQLTMTTGLNDHIFDPECTLREFLVYKTDAGKRWAYHTAPYTLLDKVILKASGQRFYNQYFNTKIGLRIGMNGIWIQQVDRNNIYFSDARSMARFGLLMLNRGVWNTDTLLADTSYFNSMTNASQILNPSYGYLMWLNGKASYMIPVLQDTFPGSWAPDAPKDMIAAIGKSGQFINIVPSQRLIMVRMGDAPDTSYDVPMQFNNDIWIKLNELINNQTAVEKTDVPTQFMLKQNYPNPFNPSTTIMFSIPVGTRHAVSLRVYDILGREAATLINESKSAGSYQVEWNVTGFTSGVYFYRLICGSFTETKKLLLLK